MNDVITKTFCNVITGLTVCAVVILNLDLMGLTRIDEVWTSLATRYDATLITGIFILSYLIGIIFNAFGLLFDDYLADRICSDAPTEQNIKAFWLDVEEHVLAYRDHVWSYYFCYRNLIILLIPGAIGCFGSLWYRDHLGWAFTSLVLFLALGYALFVSVREMLALYYDITKSFP